MHCATQHLQVKKNRGMVFHDGFRPTLADFQPIMGTNMWACRCTTSIHVDLTGATGDEQMSKKDGHFPYLFPIKEMSYLRNLPQS